MKAKLTEFERDPDSCDHSYLKSAPMGFGAECNYCGKYFDTDDVLGMAAFYFTLRERAEKAEEKALKLEQKDACREMELFSLLNLLDVDKEHQSGLLDMWQTCRILAGKTIKELKANRKMIERMIEAGNRLCELAEELDDLVDEFRAYPDLFSWRALVAEWKERK